MNKNVLVYILSGLVILLLGIIIGQNFGPTKRGVQNDSPPSSFSETANNPERPDPRKKLQAPFKMLTSTEYWISYKHSIKDQHIGYSSWAVLRPGGNFILEKCQALEENTGSEQSSIAPPANIPCTTLIDGKITTMENSKMVVAIPNEENISIPFKFKKNGANEELMIDFKGDILFEPGSKNTLMDQFERLDSVIAIRKAFYINLEKKERAKNKNR